MNVDSELCIQNINTVSEIDRQLTWVRRARNFWFATHSLMIGDL